MHSSKKTRRVAKTGFNWNLAFHKRQSAIYFLLNASTVLKYSGERQKEDLIFCTICQKAMRSQQRHEKFSITFLGQL